jgi:hypothetical protein
MPSAMLLMLIVKLNKFYFTRSIATFTSVQDDKFAKKNELWVNIYIIAKKYIQKEESENFPLFE